MTLRLRLSWMHGLLIAAVVFCVGGIRYHLVSYRSSQAFNRDLLRDAEFVASRVVSSDGWRLAREGLPAAKAAELEELWAYCVISDDRGQVLPSDQYSPFARQILHFDGVSAVLRSPEGFVEATLGGGHRYRFVSVNLGDHGHASARLHLGRSVGSLVAVLAEYRVFYLYTVPLVLAISAAVAWYLSGRAVRPFEEIAQTAEQINARNLSTQIQSKHRETEILRLVNAFNAMVRRLDESFRQMRQFNEDAAHELRTPLTILLGETEVALRSPGLPDEIRSVLASNLEELSRLTRIVDDLLTLADAEVGDRILTRTPVALQPLLSDLVDQMNALAVDRGVRLRLGAVPETSVYGDELWLRRALLNLIDNAIKYSKDDGDVHIVTELRSRVVRISVIDNGIGIAGADLPYIFNRLYRSDPARGRTSGGAGLGLALVKWVVEAHGGEIHVTSVEGKGSRFDLDLPLRTG